MIASNNQNNLEQNLHTNYQNQSSLVINVIPSSSVQAYTQILE